MLHDKEEFRAYLQDFSAIGVVCHNSTFFVYFIKISFYLFQHYYLLNSYPIE